MTYHINIRLPLRDQVALLHKAQAADAINQAAELAAESAIDAFGSDPDAEIPSPETAWEFLNDNVYVDGGIERPAALPEFLPRQFKHDYWRHVRRLRPPHNLGN
ncbi:MAG TPA: hypothetical protein VIY49_01765 [Bryobacteraceae bacterium]